MNWQEELSKTESLLGSHKVRDWQPIAEFVYNIFDKYPDNVETSIRAIYLVHNILVEEIFPMQESDEITNILKKCFNRSYETFYNNSEFLFFIGKILHVAEWYFGLEDDNKPMPERLAFKMQRKAYEQEPNNQLYRWAYVYSLGDDKESFLLSKTILYGDRKWLSWLISKGFPGKYMIESVKYCYKNYI